MRADLIVGNKFPDIELPDTSGTVVKLSELMKGLPTVEELRMDFWALMSKRPDWEHTADWQPVRETGLKPEK